MMILQLSAEYAPSTKQQSGEETTSCSLEISVKATFKAIMLIQLSCQWQEAPNQHYVIHNTDNAHQSEAANSLM